MAVSLIIFEIEQDIGQTTPMFDIYTVFQKNVTTFLMISWTRSVRLQRCLAHVLL